MSGSRSKVCRQCHRTKLLRAFISKNNEGICIICSTCRENQMRRYYGTKLLLCLSCVEKKSRMQRAGISPCYQRQRSSELRSPIPANYLPLVPANTMSFSSNQSFGLKSSSSFTHSLPYPCAKWIAVKQFCSNCELDNIYVAKLLFHPSGHQWMNQGNYQVLNDPDRKVKTDLSPVWTGLSDSEERP